ncbi:MAG: diacylglycerol/lipid kinase family protein [Candidatus Helarchaeota archaeon]
MLFIINPKSANGKTEKRWYKEIQPLIDFKEIEYNYVFTEWPNHATDLAREAIKNGEDFIVAVGGDGTFNEVANGFFEEFRPINPQCTFGVIASGTGSDFIKTAEIPKLFTDAVNLLLTGQIQKQDVGIARYTDLEGNPSSRLFINVADTGLGGDVVDRVNRTTKRFGGKFSFLVGSIRGILHHHKSQTRMILDDDEANAYDYNANMTCICIGKYFGGGMMISPNSISTDGFFNVITIQDASRWKLLRNIGKIYKGKHLELPEAKEHALCKKVRLTSESPVFLDLDGEQVGKGVQFEFEILPNSLPVVVGKKNESTP